MAQTPTKPAAWDAQSLADDPHQRADKAQRVRAMFADIVPAYDLNNRLHSFGRDQAWRRGAVKLVKPQSTDVVLDVACGTGDLSLAFDDAKVQRVVGLDFTQEMLPVAEKKSARRVEAGRDLTFVHGDAMDLPFEDASMDIVSIAFGLRNVADPHVALREFRRVLKPGGRLVVLEFSEPRFAPVRWGSKLWTDVIMPRTATWIARDKSGAYRYLPKSVGRFFTREQMVDAIHDVGFEQVTQKVMSLGVCVAYRGDVV